MEKDYTVMLVDDDKFLLEMYRKKFESKVGRVEVAAGSEEALSKLRGGVKPDILMLDVIMPKMDGLELLATIRKENLVPKSTSVIMLSNESGRDKIERAKTLGTAGYIVKATSVPTEVVEEALKIANLNSKK